MVDRLSSWLDELSQKAPDDGSEAKYYEKSPISDEDLLVRAEYLLGEHNPEITDILLNERTMASLEELFGETPVLFKEKANYKLPGVDLINYIRIRQQAGMPILTFIFQWPSLLMRTGKIMLLSVSCVQVITTRT